MSDDTDTLSVEEQALIDADRSAVVSTPQPAPEPEPAEPVDDASIDGAEPVDPVEPGDTADPAVAKKRPMVPHSALHEERRLRQENEKLLAEERAERKRLNERFDLVLQRMGQPAPAAPPQQQQAPPPALEQDPVGNLDGRLSQHEQILNALVHAVSGQDRQTQASHAVGQLAARASAMEREFAAKQPDYQQAYEHLVTGRRAELMAAGWSDPAEIQTFMAREAAGLAQQAFERGKNPAEIVYELAKIRGYRAPEAATETAPAAAAPQPDPAAVQQLQAIERGQQQARGINRVAGQASPTVSAATIANMSEDDFAEWYSKTTPAEKRRLGLGA